MIKLGAFKYRNQIGHQGISTYPVMQSNVYKLNEFEKESILMELSALLELDVLSIVVKNEDFQKEIPYKFGDYDLGTISIEYRSKYRDVRFCCSFGLGGEFGQVRVEFDENNIPSLIDCFGDGIIFIPFLNDKKVLLRYVNPNNFGEIELLTKVRKLVGLKQKTDLMIGAYSDYSKFESTKLLPKNDDAIFVEQGNFVISSYDKQLYTDGLDTCIALCLFDDKNKKQYLAHVEANTTKEFLIASFKGFDITKCRIYVMSGLSLSLVTFANIYDALCELGVFQKIKFVEYNGYEDVFFPQVIINNGNVYSLAHKNNKRKNR